MHMTLCCCKDMRYVCVCAGEMIAKLTLQYNRSRQAVITKELIEIISGASTIQ
jgi:F0F1-type ATP synthase gamma subunit